MAKTVAVMIGSLRRESINRKLTAALERLAAGRLQFHELHIADLPHYNDELWDDIPEAVARFKDRLDHSDAVLAITPEYNRSYPGVIKNAIDWGTRPYGQNSWATLPTAITGTSPGAIGTAVAQARLRGDMLSAGCVVMTQPEAYIQWKPEAFGPDGSVTDEAIRKFLQGFMDAFAGWIDKHG